MIFYKSAGQLPKRKHIGMFINDKLICEELFSTHGFSGNYSTYYHLNAPTQVSDIKKLDVPVFEPWGDAPYDYYHFECMKKNEVTKFPEILFYNSNVKIGLVRYSKKAQCYSKNADGDELFYTHIGNGVLHSPNGDLEFKAGDYIFIPKGLPYQFELYEEGSKFFYIESKTQIKIPRSYLNQNGQLLEDSPYCERDIKLPVFVEPKSGSVHLNLKKDDSYYELSLMNHPFDVIGWDGYLYPFVINIEDYMPKTGKTHLPPPVHKVFETDHSVICNFVPRLLDFHDAAVTAPYYHSNIDSDEVLYYLDGEFLSRKGISEGSITLHPMGLVHGPQPGKQESSIGKKDTCEYAVMIDTFEPLKFTKSCQSIHQKNYRKSWWS